METVERIPEKIVRAFTALPAASKLLVAALAVIMILSLSLLEFDSGEASEGLLPLGLVSAPDDVRMETASFLEQAQIPFEERNNDLYVPAQSRLNVLGRLNEQKIIGADEINFNSLVDLGANPLISQEHHRQMLLVAKMNAVKSMLAVRRDVGYVDIIIDEKAGLPGIGQSRIPPVAIVAIQMRGEAMSQEFADAVGHMVAGAQAGLKLQDVTVLDLTSMRHFKPQEQGAGTAGGYLEQQRRIEEHYRTRLEQFLAHVPGAVVTVTAVVRNQRQRTHETRIDDPKVAPVSSELRESSTGMDHADSARLPSGPGSNAAASIHDRPAEEPRSEIVTRDERESRFGGTETVIEDDTGYALQVNTVVGVPRSYFTKLFEEEQRQGSISASADPALFQEFADLQINDLEAALSPLIRTDPLDGAIAGQMNVVMLPDFTAPLADALEGSFAPPPAAAPAVASVPESFPLGRNAGLIALALAGLAGIGLVLRASMAASRNGQAPTAAPSALSALANRNGRVNAVHAANPDDAVSRASALLEQIHQMVNTNTDEAAAVIDQWLSSNGR